MVDSTGYIAPSSRSMAMPTTTFEPTSWDVSATPDPGSCGSDLGSDLGATSRKVKSSPLTPTFQGQPEPSTGHKSQGPSFHILHQQGQARAGRIDTVHGSVMTPAFLFCATQATLKGLSIEPLAAHNTQILLANTYHLMLQPGSDLVKDMGGLHGFMGWSGPTFTDSGGYQIFSLHHGCVSDEIKGKRRLGGFDGNVRPVKVSEEGALFVSHRDGRRHMLTPELSIQVQADLGADMICVLDECTPLHMSKKHTERSMHLSHRWEERSVQAFAQVGRSHQGLYGIVQGGIYPEFRAVSGQFVASQPFFGHAIGGSLGANKEQMIEVVEMALQTPELRKKPIHLLGIGGLRDIYRGVKLGIDTFDCVSPTRLGRHGGALIQPHYWQDAWQDFHERESINLWKACFKNDPRPIDDGCPCWTCSRYSRAYLHHLLKAKEILALTALTLHNVCFMNRYMAALRQAIAQNTLDETAQQWFYQHELLS
jgi:queuine tRNA-ribosyltransferase